MRKLSRLWILLLVLGFTTAAVDTGCATKTTTVTRETTGENGEQTTVTTTETTEEQEVEHPTGVLSTTLNVVGEIIALPFRLVGAVISFIF